jgi:tetratricopeptide (TPR) repeat protein
LGNIHDSKVNPICAEHEIAGTHCFCARSIRAQQISPSTPPPPPPAETPPAPPEPAFDPFHAEKSIEVGAFYMRKGSYDAAIDRFMDAAHYQPTLAKPWRLMGEAYEKKHDNSRAIESYKKYLEVLPHAEDAAKVKKRIATLEEKAGQEASKRPPH